MNISLGIAAGLTFLAFLIHTFIGDREVRDLQPQDDHKDTPWQRWVQVRCGWHWISYDLFMATVIMTAILLGYFPQVNTFLLTLLVIYFSGYGLVWLVIVTISKQFSNNYFQLGQWMLLWVIAGLLYFAI